MLHNDVFSKTSILNHKFLPHKSQPFMLYSCTEVRCAIQNNLTPQANKIGTTIHNIPKNVPSWHLQHCERTHPRQVRPNLGFCLVTIRRETWEHAFHYAWAHFQWHASEVAAYLEREPLFLHLYRQFLSEIYICQVFETVFCPILWVKCSLFLIFFSQHHAPRIYTNPSSFRHFQIPRSFSIILHPDVTATTFWSVGKQRVNVQTGTTLTRDFLVT